MKKFTFVIFAVFFFSLLPGFDNTAFAKKGSGHSAWGHKGNKQCPLKNNNKSKQGFSVQNAAVNSQVQKANKKGDFATLVKSTPVDEINLRPALQVERAAAKYVLAFEAYNEAKKSEDPEIRAKTGEYLRNYRESYAEFLKMMRNDNLYDPKMPKDMAGDYNRKHLNVKNEEREWGGDGLKSVSEYVKKEISAGGDPKIVASYIEEILPIEPLSYAPSDYDDYSDDVDDDLLRDGSFDQNLGL
ncbi:MAG: hypothetical protein PHF29_07045 [Candidatus Riflebacteria bacterium]|nr:hypothetical protein [Candidatus Riflebacteria bacterium]